MIYTDFDHVERYLGLSAPLDRAIRFLKEADFAALTPGRNEISGDEVFLNRMSYTTKPQEETAWEGHIQYADVHVLLSGEEQIGVSARSALLEQRRDEDSDFVGYTGPVESWMPMAPGKILIPLPLPAAPAVSPDAAGAFLTRLTGSPPLLTVSSGMFFFFPEYISP